MEYKMISGIDGKETIIKGIKRITSIKDIEKASFVDYQILIIEYEGDLEYWLIDNTFDYPEFCLLRQKVYDDYPLNHKVIKSIEFMVKR